MGAVAAPILMTLQAANTLQEFGAQRSAARGIRRDSMLESDRLNVNAVIADRQAADALARGRESEMRARSDTHQLRGSQRAAMAAQGIDVGEGSALDIQSETTALGELDATAIRNNAAREAFGFKAQALDFRTESAFVREAGRQRAHALRRQAVPTLLTGALAMGQTWRNRPRRPGLTIPKGGPTPYEGLTEEQAPDPFKPKKGKK